MKESILNKRQLISYIRNAIKKVEIRQTNHPLSNSNFGANEFDSPDEMAIYLTDLILTSNNGRYELADTYGSSNTTGDSCKVTNIVWKANRVWLEQPSIVDDGGDQYRNFYKVEVFKDDESEVQINKEIDKEKIRRRVRDHINKVDFKIIFDMAVRFGIWLIKYYPEKASFVEMNKQIITRKVELPFTFKDKYFELLAEANKLGIEK